MVTLPASEPKANDKISGATGRYPYEYSGSGSILALARDTKAVCVRGSALGWCRGTSALGRRGGRVAYGIQMGESGWF